MVFASSVTKNTVEGDMKVLIGTWTGSVNDTPGTFQTGGGAIYQAVFDTNLTADQVERVHVSYSASSGNVTVYNSQTVTAGTFYVKYR